MRNDCLSSSKNTGISVKELNKLKSKRVQIIIIQGKGLSPYHILH